MEVVDLKSEIRTNIITKFIKVHDNKIVVQGDTFDAYLQELGDNNYDSYKMIMASLIADCYERLKWKLPLNQIHSKEERQLLDDLEKAESYDEALELVLRGDNLAIFLVEVYGYSLLPISEKVNAKNNLYANSPNMAILGEDKLRFYGEFNLRYNNMIFSKEYNKDEYLNLYDFLHKACYGDEPSIMEHYTAIVYGLSYYNGENYRKLVFDMCKEFYFQKKVMKDKDPDNFDEDYLLYLICKAPNDKIVEVVSDKRELIENLIFAYMNYDYYDKDMREALDQPSVPNGTKKVLRKLHRGKLLPNE